ncbi:hypothetical protein D3C83_35080 [compost metagenome]
MKAEGVTAAEVATALGKIKASTAYGRDGSFAIASRINEDIAAGDWTLYVTLDEAFARVTAADVKRVAKTYLGKDQATIVVIPPATAAAPE